MRNRTFYILLALICLGLLFPAGGRAYGYSVVINEFMFDPPDSLGDDEDFEWIELYNYGPQEVNLDGWILNGLELTGTIDPYSFFIIARQDVSDPDEDGYFFSTYYNEQHGFEIRCPVFDAIGADLGLNNSGGEIELLDASGITVDDVIYSPLPGSGNTLEKICPFYDPGIGNWEVCDESSQMGTPDVQNSKLILGSVLQIELRTVGNLTFLDYTVDFTNKIGDSIDMWVWSKLTYIDLGVSIDLDIHFLIVPPLESLSFSGSRLLPEFLPDGDYILSLIDGEDTLHAFGPENEEFSLLSSD